MQQPHDARGALSIIESVSARARLDTTLVDRGLFTSRAKAQAAVMAGRVRIDGRLATKAGVGVEASNEITVVASDEYVSRGGTKLANALDALGVDVRGVHAIDLGASTGGFTDCMLRRGAERVIALDVGYGQLDWRLRTDAASRIPLRSRWTPIGESRLGNSSWTTSLVKNSASAPPSMPLSSASR